MGEASPITINPLYFVLGCLDEYGGRSIVEDSEKVEHFYASERKVADIFQSYLIALAGEHELDHLLEVRIEESGAIDFYSRALTALIDSRYTFDLSTSGYVTEGSEPRRADAYIAREVFEPDDRRARLSFLSGAYVRFGEGSLFRFANARHKAELVRGLLVELECGHVEVIHANPGYVPAVFEVRFEPFQELDAWLSVCRLV
jgi:hypothetical protein